MTLSSLMLLLVLMASLTASTPLNSSDSDGGNPNVGGLIPDDWLEALNKGVPGLQALNSLFKKEIENDTLRHLNETIAKNITIITTKLEQVDAKFDQVLPVVNILTNLATDVKKEMTTRFYKLEGHLAGVESNVASLDSKITGLDTKVTGLDTKVTSLESTVFKGHEQLKEKITDLDSKVTGLDTKVSGLDTKVTGLDTKVIGLDTKVTSLEKTVFKGHEQLKEKLTDLESTVFTGHELLKEKMDKMEATLLTISNWINSHNKTSSSSSTPKPNLTSNHIQKNISNQQ